ncbi:hypothetical protein HL658_00655 [Azospirillum sp. RWY-5-1]|uniref:DUF2975 domain-containing protein n=1 Tax=Azospirillum oleiclasticum TaxID=2735135 RepID=A0ABX2T1W1_9PROT|nr:hypothetical protein [Azospirillum oleiclasticum]NYZ11042.1 hypothetical protein [Azospirillum oleiclasticum]NYZ18204.1 hypothetical protein [Azospirillum oleiclasticum]
MSARAKPRGNPVNELATERWISGLLAGACQGLALLLPVLTVWYWATVTPAALAAGLTPDVSAHDLFPAGLADWQRIAGGLVSMASVALLVYGLLRMRACFLLFRAGRFFDSTAARGVRGFAAAVLGAVVARLLSTPALTGLLTMHNPPGLRFLSVRVGTDELLALLVAGAFWVIASLLVRAGDIVKRDASIV